MNERSPLEVRIGALISAYADRAPVLVDPMAMTRLAAAGPADSVRTRPSFGALEGGLAWVVLVLALLVAIIAGALAAGGLLRRGDPASLLAHWSKMHAGWVLVYADGRVLWYPDGGAFPLPDLASRSSILERRLTPEGVELVRSGAAHPSSLGRYAAQLPTGAWADPEYRPYQASRYAVCYWAKDRLRDVTQVVGRLPAPAEALLRGKERMYDIDLFLADPQDPPIECSEVTTEEARALRDVFNDAGLAGSTGGGYDLGYSVPARGVGEPAYIEVSLVPILPHGAWVSWGG